MKIYKIPENLKTIIFDIDSTLYTNEAYATEQVDIQLRHFAKIKNTTPENIRKMIEDFRSEYTRTHDGKKISLGNTLVHFGVSIEESIHWRKTLLEPALFLKKDEKLISVLTRLKEKYSLICVTNNPVLPAFKTLEAIGIEKLIPEIIGLDTTYKSKPSLEPLMLAAKKTNAGVEECLSVGDRFDIDLSLALEIGMGGILVDGVDDVYKFPEILK
ncbi:MAG: HAD family hydrolase [Treponema sp.]